MDRALESELEVVVVRSAKRRKTVQANIVGNQLTVRIPATLSQAEEDRFVQRFIERFSKIRGSAGVELAERAIRLADEYDLPIPNSIRWVSNQNKRWASCTPSDKSIRLSDRMVTFPSWVVDYVILHELAHLVEPGHGPEFHALIESYPKAEKAEGYLLGRSQAGC